MYSTASADWAIILWCMEHRVFSVAYPQSKGRREHAVNTANKIVNGHSDPQGPFDNEKAARAILSYHNIPIQSIDSSLA